MRKRARRFLAFGAALTLLAAASVAEAQSSPPNLGNDGFGWGPGMMMGPGMMGTDGFGFMCNPRAAGFAEWRMDRIEAAVRPTDAQRAALNELRAASTKAAETIAGACPSAFPEKSTERLAVMQTRIETMLQAVKIVRPAFDAFYAVLDDAQKDRLDATGPRRWGWRGWRWHW